MERQTIIAGNWKMYKTIEEAAVFIETLAPLVANATSTILIAPPYTALSVCAEVASNTNILIGAQNMSDSEEGAFTGEISARMLKDAGANFVILGHSERRTHFGETDEVIHKKLKRAIVEELPAILCVGETENQREKGDSEKVLKKQLEGCLGGLTLDELQNIIIAYEPVWAIGTGKSATPEIAQAMHKEIRAFIAKNWDEQLADGISILYGGSVKPSNIESLLIQSDIDGALIGGASLDVEAFAKMVLR